jgi:predicted permease
MNLRFWNRIPKDAAATLNSFIFHISLPALIIYQFHSIQFTGEAFFLASMAWILMGLSLGTFIFLGKVFKWDRKTIGTLGLTAGLGNTSFVGFPMVEAFYGKDALKTAILVDQLGTFLVLSTLGVTAASYFSAKNLSLQNISRRVFTFPPLYALIVAFLLRPVPFSNEMNEVLVKLGQTVTPLALVSVGVQLRLDWKIVRPNLKSLWIGLGFKMLVAPVLFTLFYAGLFHLRGTAIQVTLIESAMAPMITAAVLASEYDLNSELAGLMVGIGIPLSLLSIPAWVWVFQSLAA